ncbi:VOC family protein [Amphibacillus indicireducens]|uniref:VOC family protein n=1 Tax=Amphibacillus indicireducens TaxID=1076330 RepID=A0ABP7V0J6_9BACI
MGFHSKPNTHIGQVRLKIEDLNRSLKYYQDVIGFEILDRSETTANLTADGKTSILKLEQPENVQPKQRRTTGMYHFALLLPTKKDLADFVIHLSEKNIQVGAGDHLVSEALYIKDPDGNEIEIYVDRDPKVWDWNGEEVAMTTDPLNFEALITHRVQGEKWQGLPKETIMGHIHLHVAELEKTQEFYVKGLGFDIVNRFGSQALFLSTAKYHHHIGLNTWNGVGAPKPADNSVGMKSFELIYNDEAAIKATIANLEKIGATVVEEDGRTFTYDPSGIRIELTY